MSKSIPSKKISIADVPEVESFNGEFYYNFFTNDEKVNPNGSAPVKYLEKDTGVFDSKIIETVDFNRYIPRYVELTWKPQCVGENPQFEKISIGSNFDKLYYEEDFSLSDYTAIAVQDTNVEDRLALVVRKAIRNVEGYTENKVKSIQENIRFLNSKTNKQISPDFLLLGLNPQTTGLKFFNTDGRETKSNLIEGLKKSKLTLSINNKVIGDLVNAGAYDEVISPFADELQELVKTSNEIQATAEKTRDSSIADSFEYQIEIDKIVSKRMIDSNKYDPIIQTIGYIIEKEEIVENGKTISLPQIFIENPKMSSFVDFRLKYGSTYRYRIRTVAYMEMAAVEEDLGIVAGIGFIVASKPSPYVNLSCVENLAPPPPTDFNLTWDYKNNSLVLSWAFPVNSQQDVKKFQIFRRENIDQPYQLIKMFDFDDSVIKSDDNERPYKELVKKVESPVLLFIDNEFSKNSKFIYALCCIDAHGLSSGYSTQWEVTFNQAKNKLRKTLISTSGAPKAYPNAMINQDTFVDTIKSEWSKKIKIYFNPEYIRVHDNDNNDLKLIRAKKTDKYVLKLINIDLQKEQNIEIGIQDFTKNQRLSVNNKKVYPINPDVIEKETPKNLQTDNNGKWIQGSGKNSFKLGS